MSMPKSTPLPTIYKHNKLVTMLFAILDLDINTGYELSKNELEHVKYYRNSFKKRYESMPEIYNDENKINEKIRKDLWRYLCCNKNQNVVEIITRFPEYIRWSNFCENSGDIWYIKKHNQQIDWFALSYNANAIKYLEKHLDIVTACDTHWKALSQNPNAIHILKKYPERIYWWSLCLNTHPEAIDLLEQYPERIVWYNLCGNHNPAILRLIEKYPEKIDWCRLASNPYATHFLLKNMDKIDWYYFSRNPDIEACKVIHANPQKYSFRGLSYNTNPYIFDNILKHFNSECEYCALCENPIALPILENKLGCVSWGCLIKNPSLFEYDYLAMSKLRTKIIYDELLSIAMHPDRYGKALKYHFANGGGFEDFEF